MFRFLALDKTLEKKNISIQNSNEKISKYFAEKVFTLNKMKKYLTSSTFTQLKNTIETGSSLNRAIADDIANGMKLWALSYNVTHFTHWFQPLTGRTAEKHETFYSLIEKENSIEKFHGNQLIQQEPDASSFPNGGIRNTFEARGYTAWDPTSPAFIIDNTLCIPTIFISYTRESLDFKMPLLKSINAIDKAATKVCQYFNKNIKKVFPTLGWEQEYFLIDANLFTTRPDLVLTGRTLFGHSSSKGQQLNDHYFGSIPLRALAFMKDFEAESLKLGIPITTRHNEVAPNQFECAPMFEECNLAIDHNQLLMDIMEKVASKHNLRVLLHEKPFQGINGSGKHNNWSLSSNIKGHENLLRPGKDINSNLRFLTFLINTICAVKKHANLLRASIATAGNEHRLAENEAPPAIISIFIGSKLTKMLEEIEEKLHTAFSPEEKKQLDFDIKKIPEILFDNTDRNRTSPFAFTGDKFEFRAVGSSQNCAQPMIILNAAMAEQLIKFNTDVNKIISNGTKKNDAILEVLRDYIKNSKNILFEGNGYSEEWVNEAKKRGLENIKSTPLALKNYISPNTIKLFTDLNILNTKEIHSRYEIFLENYKLKIQIESRVMSDIALNYIIPAAIKYQKQIVQTVLGIQQIFSQDTELLISEHKNIITELSTRISNIKKHVNLMIESRKKANKINNIEEQAKLYSQNVYPFFKKIRYDVDKLEILVDNKYWPLAKYRELLFTK